MLLQKLTNASFAYDNKVVLSDVSFEIHKGDYLCIIGENGAGKSTLIKGMLKNIKTYKGSVSDLATTVGYLPQTSRIEANFPASVMEVVLSGNLTRMGLNPFYLKKHRERAKRFMSKLNILDLARKHFWDLSGGQKQRVLLARALVASDEVLILDEPCAGLDLNVANSFYELLKELNEKDNCTIIMISHDINEVLKYAKKILHINQKQLFFGSKEAFLADQSSKVYRR